MFVDDYSGVVFVSTMSTRNGEGDAKKMVLHAKKFSGKKVMTISPDGAKELKLGAAKRFLEENGTIIDDMPPYSPQSNGRTEGCNRTILEKARTIITELNVMCKMDGHKKLWPEAMHCVAHVHNRTMTKSTHRDVQHVTSFEGMCGMKPDLSHLRIFATKAMVLKPKKCRKRKMDPKTWTVIHARYATGDAYRCYIPELQRLFISKDVAFIEKLYKKANTTMFEIPTYSHDNSS